jgi:integrase
MRQALTDLSIRAITLPPKGSVTVFDRTMPGFGVRVSQGGTKSFVVMYGARRNLKTIGSYPSMTLKTARREASAFLATANPNPSKVTATEAIKAFLEHSARKNRPRTTADYQRLLNRHFPDGKLAGLTRQSLLKTLSALSHTPAEQSHALSAFNVFLNWCSVNGHIEQNPLLGIRGLGHVEQRERILSPDELKAIWKALEDDTFSTIIRLCILTGCRRGEIQHLTLQGDIATVPAEYSKNRREHNFPVGKLTASYLGKDLTFNGWGKCKARLDKASGVTGYTIHDIRRTFASLHAEIGTPVHVVEKLLNHVSGTFAGVTGTYNRYSYMDEMREAVDKYEQFLRKLVE